MGAVLLYSEKTIPPYLKAETLSELWVLCQEILSQEIFTKTL